MTSDSLRSYLSRLDDDRRNREYVAVLKYRAFSWISAYAWVAEDHCCANPTQAPHNGCLMNYGAQSFGIRPVSISFSARAMNRKILLNAAAEFQAILALPGRSAREAIADAGHAVVQVMPEAVPTELLEVVTVVEVPGIEIRDTQTKTLLLRF